MIARGFKSVMWVAAVGGAALSCYMLSLRVATERADLARVERQIIATKQQIRSLQTELGTRGRLSQLEQWNADVLALAAPASGQYLEDEFTLARLDLRDQTIAERAPVRMASADTSAPAPAAPTGDKEVKARQAVEAGPPPAAQVQPALVHRASFSPSQASPAPAPKPAGRTPLSATASASRPPAAAPARRLDSKLADEIGAAARAEKVEPKPAGRARAEAGAAGTR
jgi:hypothetical protein